MTDPQGASPATPRSTRARRVFALCLALLCAGFFALGAWQLQRLQWKNALVAQVDQRVHAAPTTAPPPSGWTSLSKEHDEYRHLRLNGRFLDRLSTRVQAVSELGAGFWVLTPFVVESDGIDNNGAAIVLVNRGFIPNGATPADAGPGPATITGLLRMSERGGGFLRDNDPQHDRWYSRDVEAIAAARGLARVAPWFVDQDAAAVTPKPGSDPTNREVLGAESQIKKGSDPTNREVRGAEAQIKKGSDPNDREVRGADARIKSGSDPTVRASSTVAPVGGLTVISFHNSHLVYAFTWFALGLMAAGAGYAIARGKI
ncbi:MAG: SURF1-like protein [Massilia sp.]|nr:SURF1-like protein [Massilia sp.]